MEKFIIHDPKLNGTPVITLKRIDIIYPNCLTKFSIDLKDNLDVLSLRGQPSISNVLCNEEDEVQIIDEKVAPRNVGTDLRTKLVQLEEFKSIESERIVRKLRSKNLIASRQPLKTSVLSLPSISHIQFGSPLKRPVAVKQGNINAVMDAVSSKLAALKERERAVMNEIRKNKKKVSDPILQEELEAMASTGQQFSVMKSRKRNTDATLTTALPEETFTFLKPAPVKYEKPKKEKTPDISSINLASFHNMTKLPAHSFEDKFHILEARDRLFQAAREHNGDKSRKLVGTCPDMCPEKERMRRIYQNQISVFEMDYDEKITPKEEWMVKEYARSSADQDTPLPHDLRPVPVLMKTMRHLCEVVVDQCELTDDSIDEWYMFMWDRTRAIRKDVTQQDVCSVDAVKLLEMCARFHIHCAERLIEQDVSVYDDKINTENLTKTLRTLKYMYNDLASVGTKCSNEPEFLCYSLLLNLNYPSIMTEIRDVQESILKSAPVTFALDVISAHSKKNYMRFFRLVRDATYLNCCILRRYFTEMRIHAIKTIARVCSATTTPSINVLPLSQLLLFESIDECIEMLKSCNFSIKQREGWPVVVIDKKLFRLPDIGLLAAPAYGFIRAKKNVLLSEVMWGEPLEDVSSFNVLEQQSFNSSDLFEMDLIPSSILQLSGKNSTDPYISENVEDSNVGDNDVEIIEESETALSLESTNKNIFGGATANLFNVESVTNVAPTSQFISTKSIFSTSPTVSFKGFGTLNPLEQSSDNSQSNIGFSFANPVNTAVQPGVVAPAPSLQDSIMPKKPVFGGFKTGFLFSDPAKIAPQQTIGMPVTPEKINEEPPVFDFTEEDDEEDEEEKQRQLEEDAALALVLAEKERKEAEKLKQEKEAAAKRDEERKIEERERRLKELARETEERIRREKLKKEAEKRREEDRQRVEEEKRREKLKAERLLSEKRRLEREKKLETFKAKYRVWKQKTFVRHWRNRAWAAKEARNMSKYLAKLRVTYPPVCDKELLAGNPFGEVIPNILLVKRSSAVDLKSALKHKNHSTDVLPSVPLVHIGHVVATSLQTRVQSLYPDPTSPFRSCFPWKLVLCLPDEEETDVKLDIFLERHFVDRFDWKFGIEAGPLTSCVDRIGSLEFHVIVRRVKGRRMLEGSISNPNVMAGTNSVLFFLTDDVKRLPIAKERLTRLWSAPGSDKMATVIFVFGSRLPVAQIRANLDLSEAIHIIICSGSSEQSLVTTLSESLSRAAKVSGPVPTRRSVTLESFLSARILETCWRRVDIAIINFEVLLTSPEPLINYYNSCIDNLLDIFLTEEVTKRAPVAHEFLSLLSKMESPLELRPPPTLSASYKTNLKKALNDLKLPPWPKGPLKKTQALNYRLHQYGKAVVAGNKLAQSHLKWRVYQAIKKTLLWKGLDIYCDEDINVILLRFPWVSVMQEFAKSRIEMLSMKKTGLVVTFEKCDLGEFSYCPTLVNDLLQYTSKDVDVEVDFNASLPIPENDSILFAYAAALERETLEKEEDAKRKRMPSITEQLEDLMNAKKPMLSPPKRDTTSLSDDFNSLSRALANLEEDLQRRKIELDNLMTDIS